MHPTISRHLSPEQIEKRKKIAMIDSAHVEFIRNYLRLTVIINLSNGSGNFKCHAHGTEVEQFFAAIGMKSGQVDDSVLAKFAGKSCWVLEAGQIAEFLHFCTDEEIAATATA